MARQRPRSQSIGVTGVILIGLGAIVLAGGATFGVLIATGVITFGPTEPSREGMVAFPSTGRPIKAYSKIRSEDLLNPETGQIAVQWIPENAVRPEMLRDLGQLIGRVARRDIGRGRVITENNLFEKGTREGVVAGIPPGKLAMVVDASQIRGLNVLRREDRFDLLATLPRRTPAETPQVEYGLLTGGVEGPGAGRSPFFRASGTRIVVEDGLVLSTIDESRDRWQQFREGLPRTRTAPEGPSATQIVVAVDTNEITPLTEALSLGIEVFAVARSGRGDAEDAGVRAGPNVEGMVAVPVSARPLEAFRRVGQADVADPTTGLLKVFYFPPDRVEDDWILSVDTILDRVLANDMGAGDVFRESDFSPPGTPEGIAGATPVGRRAVTLPKGRLRGLENLRRGDRFDVLSSETVDLRSLASTVRLSGTLGPIDLARAARGTSEPTLTVVLHDAVLLTHGFDAGDPILAVLPEEVTPLTETVATAAELHTVARSGVERPPEPPNVADSDEIPERRPRVGLHRIEHLSSGGSRREELWIRPVGASKIVDADPETDSPDVPPES